MQVVPGQHVMVARILMNAFSRAGCQSFFRDFFLDRRFAQAYTIDRGVLKGTRKFFGVTDFWGKRCTKSVAEKQAVGYVA